LGFRQARKSTSLGTRKGYFNSLLDDIDTNYRSNCKIYVNSRQPIEAHKRGIFLVVNGRVIEKDLFALMSTELTSPNTIAYRIRGFVQADYLQPYIQANREDFFDSELIKNILDKLRDKVQEIIDNYKIQRHGDEEEQAYNQLLQRIESAKNKHSAPNSYLQALGLNFRSNPEFEQEVVLVIAQLCQQELLPFQILDYNSGSHIDCVVKWPLTQDRRYPNFIAELEIETSLDHFFEHNHDFRTKPDICCWEIRQADFERMKRRYIAKRPESIVSVELRDPEDADHFGHQKELHITVRTEHNEQNTKILRVYVLTDLIEKLAAEVRS